MIVNVHCTVCNKEIKLVITNGTLAHGYFEDSDAKVTATEYTDGSTCLDFYCSNYCREHEPA